MNEDETFKELSIDELKKLTKLSRKSWTVRVLRYNKILPCYLYEEDPNSSHFKTSLKSWIKENIPPDGGKIFKGKADQNEETDWLSVEVNSWKLEMDQEAQSYREYMEIEET